MNARITQQELESYLWGAATILRGLVDAGDYKQFVFPLLFYKRLSDVWDADFAEAMEETGDKKYARSTANDRYLIPDGAHWNEMRGIARVAPLIAASIPRFSFSARIMAFCFGLSWRM